jgi:hypothetical protein
VDLRQSVGEAELTRSGKNIRKDDKQPLGEERLTIVQFRGQESIPDNLLKRRG